MSFRQTTHTYEERTHSDFQQLQLQTQRTSLTIFEKMKLLMNNSGQIVRVREDSMRHTEQGVIESVKVQIQEYAEQGFFSQNLSYMSGQAYPIMVFSAKTGELYDYFWEVNIVFQEELQEMRVFCVIDGIVKKYRPDLLEPSVPSADGGGISGNQEQQMAEKNWVRTAIPQDKEKSRSGGTAVQTAPRNRRSQHPVTMHEQEGQSDGQA